VDKVRRAGGIAEVARIIVRAAPKLDWDKVADYVGRFGSVALAQRLGYLATRVGVVVPPAPRQRLLASLNRNSRSFLDPEGAKENAIYDREWQVMVNVPERELLSDL
jgi:predicted transcriptional regulator of viral defense system